MAAGSPAANLSVLQLVGHKSSQCTLTLYEVANRSSGLNALVRDYPQDMTVELHPSSSLRNVEHNDDFPPGLVPHLTSCRQARKCSLFN